MFNHLQAFGKKKSKKDFKRQLQLRAGGFGILGVLSIQLPHYLKLSSYGEGFCWGLAIAMFVGAIYQFALTSNDKRLTQYYIGYYDERRQTVQGLALQLTLALVTLLLIFMATLDAFWQMRLPYHLMIVVLLYSIILGRVIITAILDRFL